MWFTAGATLSPLHVAFLFNHSSPTDCWECSPPGDKAVQRTRIEIRCNSSDYVWLLDCVIASVYLWIIVFVVCLGKSLLCGLLDQLCWKISQLLPLAIWMLKRIQVTLRSKDDGTTGLTGMKRVPEVCQMKQMQRKCNANATHTKAKHGQTLLIIKTSDKVNWIFSITPTSTQIFNLTSTQMPIRAAALDPFWCFPLK